MKRLGLALAAAAALSAAPLAAHAQRAKAPDAAPAAPAAKLDAKTVAANKARGMKEAPPLVAASDIKTCQVADANYRGSGTQKGADGKPAKFDAYEVACQEGPGYLLLSSAGQPKPQTINCIIASGAAGGTKCELAQNVDIKVALAPYVRQSGRTCEVSNGRYVGSTSGADALTYYEVACGAAPGFLLAVSETGAAKPQLTDCLAVEGSKQACTLTTKAQMLQNYASSVTKSGKACTVSDVRSIGQDKRNGDIFTEIGCGSAPGFVLVTDKGGAYKSTLDCGKADALGGCKLTDATVAQTADSAAYTKLAAKAGFPCAVKQYRYIGTDAQNREVVELACSDHPNGAMAAFSETGRSDIYDCVRAPIAGGSECKLTDKALVYPKYTEALAAKGRSTCKVSGASYMGRSQSGAEYVETACADGAPGWVIGFKPGTTAADEVLTCKQASNSGMACKLATNTAGNKG